MPVQSRLRSHVEYLASDALEGRETGTTGEEKASEYIISQFSEIALLPAGTAGYFQEFDYLAKRKAEDFGTRITMDGKNIQSFEYYVLPFSTSGDVSGKLAYVNFGITAPDQQYDDYSGKTDLKGKIFLIEMSSPDGVHPHSKYKSFSGLREKIELAEKMGAAAILFINHDANLDDPAKDWTNKTSPASIPVIFLTNVSDELTKEKCTSMNGKNVAVKVSIKEDRRKGHNVIGKIDGKGDRCIVIGAHYDHLGWGDESNSLHRGERAIHNGADDNASGISALIELARALKSIEDSLESDYYFMAFSGEEEGLLGSGYFVKNPTIVLDSINCMLNMDMIGRLDTLDPALAVYGYGTSAVWKDVVTESENKMGPGKPFRIKTSDSGVGPSDQTSFYLKNIPVLHFFTGTHSDYHKPSDDIDKINFPGMESVYEFILTIIHQIDDDGKLPFTKTVDSDPTKAPKLAVTLGIIPDYMFEGPGVRVDGVTAGKPAEKAGIKAGDVILKLGDFSVKDMQGYMQALGNFKKGDKPKAKVKRAGEEIEIGIEF